MLHILLFLFFIYFIKTITWVLNICCLFHETGYLILLLCNELLFFTTLMCHLNYKITSNTINIKNLQHWCNQQFLSFYFYHIIPRKILRYIKPIFSFKFLRFLWVLYEQLKSPWYQNTLLLICIILCIWKNDHSTGLYITTGRRKFSRHRQKGKYFQTDWVLN